MREFAARDLGCVDVGMMFERRVRRGSRWGEGGRFRRRVYGICDSWRRMQ